VGDFLLRLKQRKLVQWALAYIAAAFALIQVIDVVAQRFGWPGQIERLLILVLAIGFLVTLVLAWYHGERGVQRVSGTELLILALLLAIGGGLLWRFGPTGLPAARVAHSPDAVQSNPETTAPDSTANAASSGRRAASVPETAQAITIPAKSIAVLPLSNDSGDKDQQYFSDGLSDDLINALSQIAGLKVIGRSSSFQFRNSAEGSKAIGEKLGVAHLLEGSVQRADHQVRISATLINAIDGSILWSQQYDRPYKDLFKLQDEITAAVAGALRAKLLQNGSAVVQVDRPPSGDLAAYNAYQQGRFYAARNNQQDLRTAVAHYEEAVRLDPSYATAYAWLGSARLTLAGNYSRGANTAAMYAQAQAAINDALRLNPLLPRALLTQAGIMSSRDFDWRGGQEQRRRALALAPNDPGVIQAYAWGLAVLGQTRPAIDLTERALQLDPLQTSACQTLAFLLAANGRLDEAKAAIDKAVELQPGSDTYRTLQAYIATWRGDFPAALKIAQSLPRGLWHDVAMAVVLQIGPDRAAADVALQHLIDDSAETNAYQIAEIYALRRDPDDMFKWLDRAWDSRDPGIVFLLNDPFLMRYKGDPRYAAFARKAGLPTTTDAKALP
jgi:serine/threonine-protein kinase